jgi:hypothetical protein
MITPTTSDNQPQNTTKEQLETKAQLAQQKQQANQSA